MAYTTIFNTLPGSPATNPASLIDNMFNRVGQIAVVPCDATGSNQITLTPQANTPPISTYTNHTPVFSTIVAFNSTGLVTLQVGSLSSLPVYKMDAATQLASGDLVAGRLLQVVFESSLNGGGGGFIALQTLLPATGGSIGGTSSIKTANYTVTNLDKGSTLTVNNNTQYTFTFNAASGYDSNFQVRIYNGNQIGVGVGAGILLSIPGVTLNVANNFLYPGQSVVVQNINGTWSLVGGQQPRWINQGAQVYIDPTIGSDTANDGLVSGRPFLTIAQAYGFMGSVVDGDGGPVTIKLNQGTHQFGNGMQFVYPLVGKGALIILGDQTSLSTAANYIVNVNPGQTLAFARDLSTTLFEGVFFQTTGANSACLSVSNGATMDAFGCQFGGFPGGTVCGAASAGTCSIVGGGGGPGGSQINGNFVAFAQSTGAGFLTLGNNFVIPTALTFTVFATVGSSSVIDCSPATFSGAGSGIGSTGRQWSSSNGGGVINAGVLPGATPGTDNPTVLTGNPPYTVTGTAGWHT